MLWSVKLVWSVINGSIVWQRELTNNKWRGNVCSYSNMKAEQMPSTTSDNNSQLSVSFSCLMCSPLLTGATVIRHLWHGLWLSPWSIYSTSNMWHIVHVHCVLECVVLSCQLWLWPLSWRCTLVTITMFWYGMPDQMLQKVSVTHPIYPCYFHIICCFQKFMVMICDHLHTCDRDQSCIDK